MIMNIKRIKRFLQVLVLLWLMSYCNHTVCLRNNLKALMFYCNHTVCLRNNFKACNDKKKLCHTDIQITNAKILNRIEENKRKFEEKKLCFRLCACFLTYTASYKSISSLRIYYNRLPT